MTRVRVIGGPDKAAIGQPGTVQRQDPGWENDGVVLVALDNGLDGLWWPEDLGEITRED